MHAAESTETVLHNQPFPKICCRTRYFIGIPATDKEVSIDVMDIFTVTDGRIVEHWTVSDMLGPLRQLGVAPGT
jgi:predicted ester cyclase